MIGNSHAPAPSLSRRDFAKSAAAAAVAAAASPRGLAAAPAAGRLVGAHVAAHSFYDEGVGHVLDFLQGTAGVNALFVSSNSYYGDRKSVV